MKASPETVKVWPALEKAARVYARAQGLDEEEFVKWLKQKAREGKERKANFTSHAEKSLGENE